jgi:peptidoglycan/xylan/chitin deacetylase (PgdA/CDA1 family)/glycosyltransferase involved in cell wall biosynthesis
MSAATKLQPVLTHGTANYEVVCICDGCGFPLGSASAARITVIGNALQEAGFAFRLLHCGPSPLPINTERSGVYRAIPFEYTTVVRRPGNAGLRLLVYIRALLTLAVRLVQLRPARHRTLIYLYVMDGLLNPYAAWLCRFLRLPVVQELCEWLPGEPGCSAFSRWLHKEQMFRSAAGVLAISTVIEERARERCARINPRAVIHRLPSIVDAHRFAAATPLSDSPQTVPNFVYCGTWTRDVYFLIRAFARVRKSGWACKLRIVGGSAAQLKRIRDYAVHTGLALDDLVLMGCVDERTLESSYKMGAALLLPLPNDDRSRTRLPNKLGEYLASGRPVVTGRIGDLTAFLEDGVNAYLSEPGDEAGFAAKMLDVLQNPAKAAGIGAAGQQACFAHLDYRAHVTRLAAFFAGCMNSYPGRKALPSLLQARNVICGVLAYGIIGCGMARRAMQRAKQEGVVTSLYFHKPNRRLLAKCVAWLARHGYQFISVAEVIDFVRHGKTPPRGAVWISFDDACKEIVDEVLPILREYRIPATFFVPTGIIEGDGQFPWLPPGVTRRAMTLDELRLIIACPEASFGSHTVHHAVTSNLTDSRLRYELQQSRQTLESWTQTRIACFAFPEGKFDGRERSYLQECGYQLAATTENAFVTRDSDPYYLPRFSVADDIWFSEALCNMVGVWRPVTAWLRRLASFGNPPLPQAEQSSELASANYSAGSNAGAELK